LWLESKGKVVKMDLKIEYYNRYGEIETFKEVVESVTITDGYIYYNTGAKTGRTPLKAILRVELED